MAYRPYRLGKCIGHAVLIWIGGFVWGMIVFMTPPLKNIPSVPFVSKFPAISLPLLLVYVFVIYFLAKRYLAGAVDKRAEAWKYGIGLVVINIVLDTLVIVVAFKSHDYFSYLSIWIAYALLLFVPVVASRQIRS
jgi:hypothetical protein